MTQVRLEHGYVWVVFAYDQHYPSGEDVLAIYDNMDAAEIHKEMIKNNDKGVYFDYVHVRQITVHSKCRDVFEPVPWNDPSKTKMQAKERWN